MKKLAICLLAVLFNAHIAFAAPIQATQLVDEYDTNEVAADLKYKGKKIQVKGYVESLGRDLMDDIYVSLSSDNDSFRSVQCYFDEKDAQEVAKIAKGQLITIEGICDGLMMNVFIMHSKVVD